MRSKTDKVTIVVEDNEGKEYLGKKYKLVEVDNSDAVQKDKSKEE